MRVAIIGAGFSGLAAGYYLAKKGASVAIYEAGDNPGGLAVGFENPKWEWTLEKHYHHWFTDDEAVLALAKEIGHKVITKRPKTSTFIDGEIYQLDSVLSLLLFNKLSFVDRIRTGLSLAYLKLTPSWKNLEKVTAQEFLKKWNGNDVWELLWKPLFEKKFSKYANDVPASWFWARIKKRTQSLAYPEGGFLKFAEKLSEEVVKKGGALFFKTPVERVTKRGDKFMVKLKKDEIEFDKVICTLASPLFIKIVKGLPEDYVRELLDLKGIGAVNLLLSLKQKFLEDGTYWLNINAEHFPFLAVVEHTNFMDKKYYAGEHLVYIANYLPHEHEYYVKNEAELFRDFFPFLKTINPKFDNSWLNSVYLFKAPFAQPIIPLNYSQKVPSFETPVPGLYLCNIQQVYPWDRGTNYAVKLGEEVADLALKSK